MKTIRVAFFAHTHDLKTGGNNSLLTLAKELNQRNIDCFVFLPKVGEFSAALDQCNVKYAVIPTMFWIYGIEPDGRSSKEAVHRTKKLFKRAIYLIKYFYRYVEVIKYWQPDVLYTNTTALFEGAILSWWLKIPHIWHVRELKGFQFQYDFGNNFFKLLLKRSDAQIFVSHALKNALSAYLNPAKTHVIYNGISAPQHMSLPSAFIGTQTYTFAMVGRMQFRKQPDVAIKAISYLKNKYPNIHLLIAGGAHPSYLNWLKSTVRNFDVEDKVTFIGEVDNPYHAVYSRANAYLMCSTNETFGRVTVEAMLAKLPVIGYKSDITGTKEIVVDEVTGLLYEQGANELAACMERFIENPDWARKLGENGYKVAQQKFGTEAYVTNIHRIIVNLS